MSKSRSSDHLGFIRAVLQDVVDYYPDYRRDMERDLSRLLSHAQTVGDRVYLIDLPALGKVLDLALESSALPRTNLALSAGINSRTTVPRLFQGLWLRVFERDGCLKQDVDTNALFFLRTLTMGQKKYRKECDSSVTYTAIQEFYDTDEKLPIGSPLWDTDGSDLRGIGRSTVLHGGTDDPADLFHMSCGGNLGGLQSMLVTAQQVADRVASGFGEYQPDLFAFRHGPGATAEHQRGASFKYLFPSWGPRLEHIFPAVEFGVANPHVYGRGFASIDDLPFRLIEGASRLIAVPKTQKTPRLIAAEPTANQWCQQNVRDFLDVAIQRTPLRWSIDFRNQGLSQEGARLGSISGDTATIDLSSASDRVSTWLVERIFRRNHSLLSALVACRTRYITNDLDKKQPKLYKLRKFSSMGSALTFPIQSIVFYVLCVAAGLATDGKPVSQWKRYGKMVRVYGDDLIVPRTWVPRVIELFTKLHLKVNKDKTFWNGKFRESCGLDAYGGDDVTPGYLLHIPDEADLGSVVSTVQVSNNFLLKGLWNTARWVERLVPRNVRSLIPVVPIGSGTFGLYSYSGYDCSTSKERWNNALQRYELRTLSVSTKRGRNRHEGFANLLQYFTEEPAGPSQGCEGGDRVLSLSALHDSGESRRMDQGSFPGSRLVQGRVPHRGVLHRGPTPVPVAMVANWESGRYGRAMQTIRRVWVPLDAVVPDIAANAAWNKAVSVI